MLNKKTQRAKRKLRIAAKIRLSKLPRLAIFRSNQAIYASIIDDQKGQTLAAARVAGKDIKAASELGTKIAKLAADKKITKVVFDRSGYLYHGKVKAVADAARQGGLKF